MPDDNTTPWIVKVSPATDSAMYRLLKQRGLKKGDPSKFRSQFIEELIQWQCFEQTLLRIQTAFASQLQSVMQSLIDEACHQARHGLPPPPQSFQRAAKKPAQPKRAVLDTPILVSALLIGNWPPAQLLPWWRQGHFTLVTSKSQLDEVQEAILLLLKRLDPSLGRMAENPISQLSEALQNLAVLMKPTSRSTPSSTAFTSNQEACHHTLLALAAASQAEYLVTNHLISSSSYWYPSELPQILSVSQFLDPMRNPR
jgi:putative PIN family toxin of toxin-antitoxin system